ncbi:MAG TPA: AgmX/PglI C-terminal domain-containing protein [Polyangiaceae bacterium]|jgi:hypothetical protein|nr:AgmX/PglI C-terminal domain-containing protein [Polyangiaceae bacterium]
MKTTLALATSLLVGSVLAGCGGDARSPSDWQDDTQKMLESSNEAIKTCYDAELQKNRKLQGSVTVTFTILRGNGHVKKPRVDQARTTGGDALKKCVVDNIQDLKLEPPDANHGEATYTWIFNSSEAPASPAPADAPADASKT